jgi:hypothetical protein
MTIREKLIKEIEETPEDLLVVIKRKGCTELCVSMESMNLLLHENI